MCKQSKGNSLKRRLTKHRTFTDSQNNRKFQTQIFFLWLWPHEIYVEKSDTYCMIWINLTPIKSECYGIFRECLWNIAFFPELSWIYRTFSDSWAYCNFFFHGTIKDSRNCHWLMGILQFSWNNYGFTGLSVTHEHNAMFLLFFSLN